jgi:hypothetical protein
MRLSGQICCACKVSLPPKPNQRPGDGVHLAGALQVDVLALALVGVESVVAGHHDEARETYELTEGMEFLLGGMSKVGLFILAHLPISDI